MPNNRAAADILTDLQHYFGYSRAEMAARSAELGDEYALNPNFITNVRHRRVIPNLRHLYAISTIFRLTIGSTFSIFGFDLDALVETELSLNERRTRLIEHYQFGPGESWVPSELGSAFGTDETAFLGQMIGRWQQIPSERIMGQAWQDSTCLYGKLGIYDSDASPDIPPGAYIQIFRVGERSLQELSPTSHYFVQHPRGYTACRCSFDNESLILHPSNPSLSAPRRLLLRTEARVIGVVTAFAATLPAEGYRKSIPRAMSGPPVGLAPWEHTSLSGLFQTSCRRFGISRHEIDQFNVPLREIYGIHISGRYSQSLYRTKRFPQTSSALAMAIIASLRLRDVFRSCGFSIDDHGKYQLRDLLNTNPSNLSPQSPLSSPQPAEMWATFLTRWREWPVLFRRVLIEPDGLNHAVLRLNQSDKFQGLNRMLRPGSILRIDTKTVNWGAINKDAETTDWTRPLYVLEYGRNSPSLVCGYLLVDGENVWLTPHPTATSTDALRFTRSEIDIVGKVTGIIGRLSSI